MKAALSPAPWDRGLRAAETPRHAGYSPGGSVCARAGLRGTFPRWREEAFFRAGFPPLTEFNLQWNGKAVIIEDSKRGAERQNRRVCPQRAGYAGTRRRRAVFFHFPSGRRRTGGAALLIALQGGRPRRAASWVATRKILRPRGGMGESFFVSKEVLSCWSSNMIRSC